MMKKKFLSLIFVLFVGVCLSACGILPAEEQNDISHYLKVNKYVQNLLEQKEVCIFPDDIPTDSEPEYYYSYSGGDEAVSTIYLRLRFQDEKSYQAYVQIAKEKQPKETCTTAQSTYYLFSNITTSSLKFLFTDTVYDGIYGDYYCIKATDNDLQIEYLLGEVKTTAVEREKLKEVLSELYDDMIAQNG